MTTDVPDNAPESRGYHRQQAAEFRADEAHQREATKLFNERFATAVHLRKEAATSWQGHNFDFTGVVFDSGDFHGAVFSRSEVYFDGAQFAGGDVTFDNAQFTGGTVTFNGAEFSGSKVDFDCAELRWSDSPGGKGIAS